MTVLWVCVAYTVVVGACLLKGVMSLKTARIGGQYPAQHLAKYGIGGFLITTVSLVMVLLFSAVSCTDGTRTEDQLTLDGCAQTQKWYAVLTDWQSGLGAFIGLLGLAWSSLISGLMNQTKT